MNFLTKFAKFIVYFNVYLQFVTVNAVHGINLKCTHEAKGQPTILVSCYELNHAKCIVFQRGVIQNMASTEMTCLNSHFQLSKSLENLSKSEMHFIEKSNDLLYCRASNKHRDTTICVQPTRRGMNNSYIMPFILFQLFCCSKTKIHL